MAEFVLKYADARGQIHQQVAEANSERELRDKYTQQGYLVYSVQTRGFGTLSVGGGRSKKLNTEKFLIFNQQFVTLIKAGLPILKSLDLLGERLTDKKLKPFVDSIREEVKNGSLLSAAFEKQGLFPPMYVTSVMAGEKAGSLTETLERYVAYQKMALAVRKKLMLSLIYPTLLLTLVLLLIVFLVTYVVPNFAVLYQGMSAELPAPTRVLIAIGTTARNYILVAVGAIVAGVFAFRFWSRGAAAQEKIDQVKLRMPVVGEIWIKFQVAQFARVMSTLLVGGIPLPQALETAGDSVGSRLIKRTLVDVKQLVKEGQPLSGSLGKSKVFPPLAVDMIEVGESTGALPAMLGSVAEFFEEDVTTRLTAILSLIEPAIMIFMGGFVAFVLIALYLPIFSLADTLK
ncbi:MAG: type II secretion system F family protein [Bryobacteraceae bacterium]|nr:type II secretion system F family protein [Bryobacteraceae bacterium]